MPTPGNPKALEKAARKAQRQQEREERRAEKRERRGKDVKKKAKKDKQKKKKPLWLVVLSPFFHFFQFLAFLLSILMWGAIAAVFVVVGTRLVFQPDIPKEEDWERVSAPKYEEPLRVFAGDGSFTQEYGEQRREPIAYVDTPERLIQAFIAAEDQRFKSHAGVDPMGVARAALHALKTGSKEQGASTITMQVARHVYLNKDKTFLRKIREIFISFEMEKRLSKEQIMELYMNDIFFGHHSYGITAAAKTYYGKKVADLSLAQMAMIAGLPKAPSQNNPVSRPAKAKIRRSYVLGRMFALGFITEAERDEALAEPVTAGLYTDAARSKPDFVSEMVRAEIIRRYGPDALKHGYSVTTTIDPAKQKKAVEALRKGVDDYEFRHGYRGAEARVDFSKYPGTQLDTEDIYDQEIEQYPNVGELPVGVVASIENNSILVYRGFNAEPKYITIDYEGYRWAKKRIDLSKVGPEPVSASQVVKEGDIIRYTKTKPPHLSASKREKAAEIWVLAQKPEVDGALVSINSKTGEIEALVGGYDFRHSKWNRAVQARRQAGSSFKPFLYAAGLEKGLTPASMVNDNAVVIYDPIRRRRWSPQNYNRKFNGPSTLRLALAKSMNLVSVRLLGAVGTDDVIRYSERFGFSRDRMPRDLSLSLGTNSLSPLELATGFSVFSNGGYYLPPHFIREIKDRNGEVIFRAAKPTFCDECYTPPFAEQQRVQANAIGGADEMEGAAPEEDGGQTEEDVSELSATLNGQPAEDDPLNPANIEDVDEEEEKEPVEPPVEAKRVISPQIAYQMRSMLSGVVRSGGTAWRVSRAFPERTDLGGKTGTTNDQKDAWFTGLNGELVTTVWVGYNKLQSLGKKESGGASAMPIWVNYMQFALKDKPQTNMPMPSGIVTARISTKTGLRTSWDNPDAEMETFRDGYLPEKDDYQAPILDPNADPDAEEPVYIDPTIAADPYATEDVIDDFDPTDPAYIDDFDAGEDISDSDTASEDGLDSLDDDAADDGFGGDDDGLGAFGAGSRPSNSSPSTSEDDDDGGASMFDDL